MFDHTRRSRIIDLGSIKRRLSLSLPRPTNLKRSLSFMARHTQDPPTTSTIISQPRSSRSPSLSFQLKNKPLVIPTRPLTSPRNSPPPDFLLDDDPFANLTGCRHGNGVSCYNCLHVYAHLNSSPAQTYFTDSHGSEILLPFYCFRRWLYSPSSAPLISFIITSTST